jgi:sugar/nucleoside kinase (ribokinase family)
VEPVQSGEGGRPWLLVVGAATRDIDERDERGWRLGGSVVYCSLAAARLGVRVRSLIGADALAAEAPELGLLRDAGVEIEIVPLGRGPVFENRHVGDRRVQFARDASDAISVSALPAAWRSAPAVLFGPIAGELRDEWADVPSADALVALGWQGLLRELVPGEQVRPLPITRHALAIRADIAVVSAEDALGGGASLTELVSRPWQMLVVTHGPHGGMLIARRSGHERLRLRRVPSVRTPSAEDPTGAGDVFLAAWCAARMVSGRALPAWRSLAVAATAASLAVGAVTLADLPDTAAVRERLLTPVGQRVGRL